MKDSIRLHPKHCLAPAMMVCPLCGRHTNGIALLGAEADKIMQQVGQKEYKEYGHNDIPDSEPCDTCKGILNSRGIIFIAKDVGESLSLTCEMSDQAGFVEELRGKVVNVPTKFWEEAPEGIRLHLDQLK
jgi:hypothetical protein